MDGINDQKIVGVWNIPVIGIVGVWLINDTL